MTIKKALSVGNIVATNHKKFDFTGVWADMLNQPARGGVWFVWGGSGSGKSSFIMALAKYMCEFGKVLYNALEEYQTDSFKKRVLRLNMQEVKTQFFVAKYSIAELRIILEKRRSPEIIIIDSEKYAKWNWNQYLALKEDFPTKTFIIVGHAKGKEPSRQLSIDIMYDAYIKIWVEGYRAFSKGREIGPVGHLTIWQDRAEQYWGESLQDRA